MRSGRCPKCQSTDIRVGPVGASRDWTLNKIRVSFWSGTTPELRVCVSCGYVEQYVASAADRAKIASSWPD